MAGKMFIKTTRVRRGNKVYEYLVLVEAVRENGRPGHRVVARLGEASKLKESGELDRIVAALRRYSESGWARCDEIDAKAAPALGGIAAAEAYWSRLGLDAHFGAAQRGQAVFAMVANRLVRPSSKRQVVPWMAADVVAPPWFSHPPLQRYYRALDHVAGAKEATEAHLYSRLTDLTNLDLRLVCYDLTSTYFETLAGPSADFPSRALGYSRDKRSDRPQVVIGLLVTGDGVPIAHHLFAGNTADVSTLPSVLEDLQARFGVGRITLVADRGLISAANLAALDEHGFDHVLATRLHREPLAKAALAASAGPRAEWVPVEAASSAACEVEVDGRRCVVVASTERLRRDDRRRVELIARTEAKLLALEDRVRAGELAGARKIAAAAESILKGSGIRRVFDLEIENGRFLYHYDEAALDYEEALAGRYVLTTSLTKEQASTARVVLAYRSLQEVEARFRVLKDFLHLRPVFHWTESRVRGHVAVCVYASVIEALMAADLKTAGVKDPDLPDQDLTARRALQELARVRLVELEVGDRVLSRVTRRSPFQAKILSAFGVDARHWDRGEMA
jgi:transposase